MKFIRRVFAGAFICYSVSYSFCIRRSNFPNDTCVGRECTGLLSLNVFHDVVTTYITCSVHCQSSSSETHFGYWICFHPQMWSCLPLLGPSRGPLTESNSYKEANRVWASMPGDLNRCCSATLAHFRASPSMLKFFGFALGFFTDLILPATIWPRCRHGL